MQAIRERIPEYAKDLRLNLATRNDELVRAVARRPGRSSMKSPSPPRAPRPR